MNTRTLIAALLEDEEERVPQLSEARAPIGRRVLRDLFAAYGRSRRLIDFFNVYADMKDIADSGKLPVDGDLYGRFMASTRALDPRFSLEATREKFSQNKAQLMKFLRQLDTGDQKKFPNNALWLRAIQWYADLIQATGADKEIFMSQRNLPGRPRWVRLQRSSAKEQKTEKLRRSDPDLYSRMMKSKAEARAIRDKIRERILEDGLIPDTRRIMNRVVSVGYDQNNFYIYDTDGETYTLQEFSDKVKGAKRSQDALLNVNIPTATPNLPSIKDVEKANLLAIPKDSPLLDGPEDDVVSLTDDPEKASAITRLYPVKKIDGRDIISKGRFKGMALDTVVNAAGRQIEGSIQYLDYNTRRMTRREVIDPATGELLVKKTREPYITVSSDGRLFLKMPGENPWKEERAAVLQLATELKGTFVDVPRTRRTEYYLAPKDFAALRETLGSVALSSKAAKMIRDYYDDLTRAEQASQATDLARYSNETLGLKEELPLRHHVKRALAWLDANGNKGICALDTGMGKTVTAISSMLNLQNKGETEKEGTNGRFMYVSESALLGNFPKEVGKFMQKAAGQALLANVERVTYRQFSARRKKDPTYGDDYFAIYFDEAHITMKKKTQSAYKAAVNCKCQHKVMLTASPMVKGPKEVLTLSSVANGIDLNSKEGQKIERQFLARFADSVGGRATRVSSDYRTAKDFRIWVKRNLFFADKREVAEEEGQLAETGLGASGRDLVKATEMVTMDPRVEEAYREEMARVRESLEELLYTFRSQPELAFEKAGGRKITAPLRMLTRLADVPNRVIPGARNPKIDRAAQILKEKVDGRSLMFTDSNELAEDTFSEMRKKFPGKGHVLGDANQILYATPQGEVLKFTQRRYPDPMAPGGKTNAKDWKTHVLNKIIGLGTKQGDMPVMTAVLTGVYAVGQNLQSFGTVIHLDRDDWSNETMKQRTARAWRSGNKQAVDEYTIDAVYEQGQSDVDADQTLDEIRRVIQEMDDDLFNDVVINSQSEKLGEDWLAVKKQQSALYRVDRQQALRALSPYASQLGEQEGGR